MIPAGCRVGVAVSGGVDSVCLLLVLDALRGREASPPFSLVVLHLNHQLRGEESDRDEAYVGGLAGTLGLPAVIERADLEGGNVEEQGRLARRAFFRRAREAGVVDRIATGHTRSDQAETVLFRILRGTGLSGLSGVLPTTEEGLIRPFLEVTRAEVLEYAEARKLEWRDDATNRDPAFARNRLRHQLLPELTATWNPQLEERLASLAELARSEDAYWATRLHDWIQENVVRDGESQVLSVEQVREEPVAFQRRLIRMLSGMAKTAEGEVTYSHIERIRDLLNPNRGDGRVQAPGVDVMRSFEWVRFAPLRKVPGGDRFWAIPVELGQSVRVPESNLWIQLSAAPERDAGECLYNEGSCLIPAPPAGTGLILRGWRPGDRLGDRKIKELFQEHRVPLWKRRNWPVLASGERVVWASRFSTEVLAAEPGTILVREWESGS